jgi:hypothetical protein
MNKEINKQDEPSFVVRPIVVSIASLLREHRFLAPYERKPLNPGSEKPASRSQGIACSTPRPHRLDSDLT